MRATTARRVCYTLDGTRYQHILPPGTPFRLKDQQERVFIMRCRHSRSEVTRIKDIKVENITPPEAA